MIEEKRLHPLSCLRGLSSEIRLRLVDCGLVLIRQLLAEDPSMLERKTGLSRETVKKIMENARSIAYSLDYY